MSRSGAAVRMKTERQGDAENTAEEGRRRTLNGRTYLECCEIWHGRLEMLDEVFVLIGEGGLASLGRIEAVGPGTMRLR